MRQICVISAFCNHMTQEFCQYFVTEGRQNERQPEPVHIARRPDAEGRTKNRELEQMIKKRIRDFEQEHSEIDLRDASIL